MTRTKIKTYSEMRSYSGLLARYQYLRLRGNVGVDTFGYDRYLNQRFYRSLEWQDIRQQVLIRDEGCDLGVDTEVIYSRPLVHHMNPITKEDLKHGVETILDPEYLITVSHKTHNAIHYGDESLIPKPYVPRSAGDTKLW